MLTYVLNIPAICPCDSIEISHSAKYQLIPVHHRQCRLTELELELILSLLIYEVKPGFQTQSRRPPWPHIARLFRHTVIHNIRQNQVNNFISATLSNLITISPRHHHLHTAQPGTANRLTTEHSPGSPPQSLQFSATHWAHTYILLYSQRVLQVETKVQDPLLPPSSQQFSHWARTSYCCVPRGHKQVQTEIHGPHPLPPAISLYPVNPPALHQYGNVNLG